MGRAVRLDALNALTHHAPQSETAPVPHYRRRSNADTGTSQPARRHWLVSHRFHPFMTPAGATYPPDRTDPADPTWFHPGSEARAPVRAALLTARGR